jgi:arginase
MRLHLISVPYRYDEHNEGLGAGPAALQAHGLAAELEKIGHEVEVATEAELPEDKREPGRTAVNIGRLGSHTASLIVAARRSGLGALVLAGDDTAAVGVVSGLQQADGAGTPIGVVWLDAHGDFNTPETSYSGILAGMPLAILAGLAGPNWRGAAGLAAPLPTDRLLIAGVRDLDDKERTLLQSTSARVIPAAELRDREGFAAAVRRLAGTCSLLSLHVDLDVLDPRLVPSSSTPAENGLEIEELAGAISAVLETGKVATVVVSSLNPGGGVRGQRSIESALAVIGQSLGTWTKLPGPPASYGG